MPIALILKLLPAIIALAFVVGSFFAGYQYKDALVEKEKAEMVLKAQKDLQDEIDKRHKQALEYEAKLQEMAKKVRTIVKTVEVEVEKPIYKQCVIPPSGVDTINQAAKSFNEERKIESINKEATKLNSKRNAKPESPEKSKK